MAIVAVIRDLVAAGLTLEQAVMAAEKFEANAEAERAASVKPVKARTAGAERQARYRASLKGEVTDSDVTVMSDSDVTVTSLDDATPPKRKLNPPRTSLRSDTGPARAEIVAEFRAAYPKRQGANPWQPAEEKMLRLLKVSADPEKLGREILTGTKAYAASREGEDPKFTMQAKRFINEGVWKDDHTKPQQRLFAAGDARAGPPRPAPHNPRLDASRQLRDRLDELQQY